MFKGQVSLEWLLLFGGILVLSILVIGVFTGFLSSEGTKKQQQVNVQELVRDCLTYKAIGNGYYPPFDSSSQGYFPFRGNTLSDAVKDWSNNRFVLTYVNLSGGNPTPGYNGDTEQGLTSVLFNSTQVLVFVGGTTAFNVNNQFTLEFWFEPLTTPSQSYLFNSSNLGVWFNSSGVSLIGSSSVYAPMIIQSNAWNYVAISFDGTNAVFYLNGNRSSSYPFSFTSSSSNLSIGGDASSYTLGLNGYLDLFRISNVSRDDTAIYKANICEDASNDIVMRP
ncbi:Concanavalin A-like lectin/glucanases superfamily protein [uncultured archaeon]|nr:Concanavalin A-like lectin/glucanases superfamily protein [uncultured archaeon]